MKSWQIVALIIGVLIVIQLLVLSIYLMVDDGSRKYERDLSISIEWREGDNRTRANYSVLVPLIVYSETGEDAISDLEQIEVTLGRGDVEIVMLDEAPYLRVRSDTPVVIKHHFSISGEDVSPRSHEVEMSSQGGDLQEGTASVMVESNTDTVSVRLELFQKSVSSNGTMSIIWAMCGADLNEGRSRYPLEKYDPGS